MNTLIYILSGTDRRWGEWFAVGICQIFVEHLWVRIVGFPHVEVSHPEKHDPISAAATFVYRISRVTKVWETFSRFISAVSIP